MNERNAAQDEVGQDAETDDNTASGSGRPIESFLTKHRAVVEEYADGDYATAWLNEAFLSWDERDGLDNGVTEQ